jgi:hypothetical protein
VGPVNLTSVAADINDYIRRCGGGHSAWYFGIAADPRHRLFSDHNVAVKSYWIFRDCGSEDAARRVEEYFHRLGCQGGPGGGDWDTRFVYAYRITLDTVEAA